MDVSASLRRVRLAGPDRRKEVVETAFRLMAERGLEGLRTREVASACGINPATLHYYFPTKEDLIKGVVDHIVGQFADPSAWASVPDDATSEAKIQHEYRDLANRLAQTPDLFVVLADLSVRAFRDPAVAKILAEMRARWNAHLGALIQEGVDRGEFRRDLSVREESYGIMTQFMGLSLLSGTQAKDLDERVMGLAERTLFWLKAR